MDNTLSVSEAAAILGVHVVTVQRACARGVLPGARLGTRCYEMGQRGGWQIPAEALEHLPRDKSGRVVWKAKREKSGPKTASSGAARCSVCEILLEESGDRFHPNDRPDAGRCWVCRAEYGEGA
jgi:excisionase family DNA binding protein